MLWGMARCLWSLGGAAGAAGVGPRGVPARRRRPADRGVCGVLRPAAGRLVSSASRRIRRRRARSSGCRVTWRRTSSPAGGSRTTSTSSCSSTRGSRRPTRARTGRCARGPVDRLVEEREVMRPLPGRRARHRPALGDPGAARAASCGSTPTTTRSTRASSAGASRSASASARSPRSCWTPASSRAGTSACFAKHRTITALEHARALRERRGEPRDEVDGRAAAACRSTTS